MRVLQCSRILVWEDFLLHETMVHIFGSFVGDFDKNTHYLRNSVLLWNSVPMDAILPAKNQHIN